MAFYDRLKIGLARTHQGFVGRMERFFRVGGAVTMEMVDDFLEVLVTTDIGVDTSVYLIDQVKEKIRRGEIREPGDVIGAFKTLILEILSGSEGRIFPPDGDLWVVMFAGVNGSGKTTTIAKMGHRWITAGHKVAFAAADTFRAGAVEQLGIWAERVGAGFYAGKYGADPSSVVYDAVSACRARGQDILLIDTAGRLHTSSNLMEELKKIRRTCHKVLPGSPHEVMLVLDATTGQNAIQQARTFNEALGVTGITLTKLDGTAKGGIIVAVARELSIPIKLIGVGEAEEDMHDFDAGEFTTALFAD